MGGQVASLELVDYITGAIKLAHFQESLPCLRVYFQSPVIRVLRVIQAPKHKLFMLGISGCQHMNRSLRET